MNLCFNRLPSIFAKACFICLALGFVFFATGLRINLSSSIPLGLYWMSSKAIEKGDYLIFCPPQQEIFFQALERGYMQAGLCPGGFGSLMKQVLALTGDRVAINAQGVWVNGKLLAYSKPFSRDDYGRKLTQLNLSSHRLNDSELLLMTNQSPISFDARYFGLLNKAKGYRVIVPLLTWGLPANLSKT